MERVRRTVTRCGQGFRLQFPLSGRQDWNELAAYGCTRGVTCLSRWLLGREREHTRGTRYRQQRPARAAVCDRLCAAGNNERNTTGCEELWQELVRVLLRYLLEFTRGTRRPRKSTSERGRRARTASFLFRASSHPLLPPPPSLLLHLLCLLFLLLFLR